MTVYISFIYVTQSDLDICVLHPHFLKSGDVVAQGMKKLQIFIVLGFASSQRLLLSSAEILSWKGQDKDFKRYSGLRFMTT